MLARIRCTIALAATLPIVVGVAFRAGLLLVRLPDSLADRRLGSVVVEIARLLGIDEVGGRVRFGPSLFRLNIATS